MHLILISYQRVVTTRVHFLLNRHFLSYILHKMACIIYKCAISRKNLRIFKFLNSKWKCLMNIKSKILWGVHDTVRHCIKMLLLFKKNFKSKLTLDVYVAMKLMLVISHYKGRMNIQTGTKLYTPYSSSGWGRNEVHGWPGREICHMNTNFVGFQNMCDFKMSIVYRLQGV